jgi:hypothetical protein
MSIIADALLTEEQNQAADKFAIAINPYNDPNLMPGAQSQGPLDFYVVEVGRRWPNGSTLKVLVKNETGNAAWAKKVIESVQTWEKYANIDFDIMDYDVIMAMPSPSKEEYIQKFVNNCDIRVLVKNGDFQCWSYVGTTCRLKAQKGETSVLFSFGSYKIDDTWVSTTIIHEFGHALGFQHEHNNENAKIPWNKEAVYAYYAKQGWDKAKVDCNLFASFTGAAFDQSAGYDSKSIMTYSIQNAHVLGRETLGGYYVASNTVLSDLDKRGALKHYPVTEGVIVYEGENFTGDFSILRPGKYGADSLGIANDKMRSFQIIGDLTLILYKNSDFSGERLGFWGESRSASSLGSNGFNDAVSSIKIARGTPKAIIYSEKDYTGSAEFLLEAGDYNLDKLGIDNDSLSSLRVFPGNSVTLYEHSNFGGEQLTFTSSVAYVGDNWNEKASSIRVK